MIWAKVVPVLFEPIKFLMSAHQSVSCWVNWGMRSSYGYFSILSCFLPFHQLYFPHLYNFSVRDSWRPYMNPYMTSYFQNLPFKFLVGLLLAPTLITPILQCCRFSLSKSTALSQASYRLPLSELIFAPLDHNLPKL